MSPNQFLLFAETLPEPLFLLTSEGEILEANTAAYRLLGVAARRLRGVKIHDLAQEDLGKLDQCLRLWARSREMLPASLRLRSADGSVVKYHCGGALIQPRSDELPALILLRCQPKQALIRSFVALNEQIERLRKEINVRKRTEERLQTLARISPVGIFRTDAEGNCIYTNERWRELAGMTEAEALGEGWARALHPEDRERVFTEWYQAAAGKAPFKTECRFQRPDGKVTWLWTLAEAELDAGGQVVGYVGAITDITERKRVEEEARIRDKAIASSISAIAIADMQGVHTYVNESYVRMWGYEDATEVLNRPNSEFVANPEELAPIMSELVQKGSWVGESVGKRKDGSTFDVQLAASVVTNEEGEPLCVMASFQDITERKHAEETVRNIAAGVSAQTGEAFFQSLVEHLAKIFDAEYSFIGLLDEQRPDLIDTVALCVHGEVVDNQSYELAHTPCKHVVEGNCDELQAYPRDIQRLFPDDPMLEEMGAHSYVGAPLADTTGKPIGLIVVMDNKPMENTEQVETILRIFAVRAAAEMERLRAEQALRDSEALLAESQRLSHLGSWDLDLATGKAVWSEEVYRLLGYEPYTVEATPKDFLSRIHPEDKTYAMQELERPFQEKGREYQAEFRIVQPDKRVRIVAERGRLIYNEQGEAQRYVGTTLDITERKQAEKELEKHREHLEELVQERTAELKAVNKELESFSYSVSHDLRAPLRAIDGFSLAVLEDNANRMDAESRDNLERVRRGAQHMSELIDDMLQLSRVTRHEIRHEKVDLSILATTVLSKLEENKPNRKVGQVIVREIIVHGDSHLLELAMDNLLGNAWKYTGKTADPRIEFGMRQQDGESVYFIKDNGAGFNMKYADKLFGAFQRLHKDADFPGTGIGLATVQRVIHRHGGRIWAEAEEGKGATFYFTLGEDA